MAGDFSMREMYMEEFVIAGQKKIRPKYASDYAVFQHCNDGFLDSTMDNFLDFVTPLLEVHGFSVS